MGRTTIVLLPGSLLIIANGISNPFCFYNNMYFFRFIGIYGSEKRVKNGYEYTRLGTKFDTISFQIIEE